MSPILMFRMNTGLALIAPNVVMVFQVDGSNITKTDAHCNSREDTAAGVSDGNRLAPN